ncbi:hypothetical protein P4O66_013333, partial [Electrophorus voltai]
MSGCRVFIGRLSPHARERDVEKFFKGYGRIREINLKNGFGFVEFDDHRDADDAVYELNGKELCSERVTIEHARSRRGRGGGPGMGGRFSPRFGGYRQSRSGGSRYGPPVRTEHRIIVENLSSRISWQDLKDLMRKVGDVTFVDAHRTNKNEGVVEFATRSDMKNAIEKLDGTDLNGRKLKLYEDRKRRCVAFLHVHVHTVDQNSIAEAGPVAPPAPDPDPAPSQPAAAGAVTGSVTASGPGAARALPAARQRRSHQPDAPKRSHPPAPDRRHPPPRRSSLALALRPPKASIEG